VGTSALENLRAIVTLSGNTAAAGRIRFDPSLARGLSYYTGAIMEITVPDLAGSLGGGGRYDNLIGMFAGQTLPACGFSLGLERILVVMGERGMFPPTLAMEPADVLVSMLRGDEAAGALLVASVLRRSGLRVMVYPDADKIGKQIKYASARCIPCVAILGEDEILRGDVTLKYLASGHQETVTLDRAGAAVRESVREARG
jgi:histidyl-tRNA synthetase